MNATPRGIPTPLDRSGERPADDPKQRNAGGAARPTAQVIALGELPECVSKGGEPILGPVDNPLRCVKARLQVSVGEVSITVGELPRHTRARGARAGSRARPTGRRPARRASDRPRTTRGCGRAIRRADHRAAIRLGSVSEQALVSPSAASIGRSAAASATLPFVHGDEAGFPTTGAMLLLAMLVVAAWAWWKGSHGAPRAGGGRWSNLGPWKSQSSAVGASVRILGSTRLGPGVALHVIEWRGAELLVGINGATGPVVLGRYPFEAATSEGVP